MAAPGSKGPLHEFIMDINYNKNGRRTDFLNADNHFAWVQMTYGKPLNEGLEVEFNQMVDNAKIIFPDIGNPGPDQSPKSIFTSHILALYSNQKVKIPNEDIVIL